MSTKRQKNIEDKLEDLGFDSIADSLRFDSKHAVESYFAIDLNRLRRETTEEEFPTSVYNQVSKLIEEWFSIQKKSNPKSRNSKMAIKRKNPKQPYFMKKGKSRIRRSRTKEINGSFYHKVYAKNGTTMYFKDGKLISKAKYERAAGKTSLKGLKSVKRKKNPQYTRKRNKAGIMMHRKDGVLISKAQFDRAVKAKGRIVKSSKDTSGLVAKTAEAKKILKKKSMTKADKSTVRRTVVLLEQAALGSKAKANPKKKLRAKKANSSAKKAMKLYHSGKAKSLKAAWRMVKRK